MKNKNKRRYFQVYDVLWVKLSVERWKEHEGSDSNGYSCTVTTLGTKSYICWGIIL